MTLHVKVVLALAVASVSLAAQKPGAPGPPRLARSTSANGPDTTILNINDFHLWIDRKGFFPWRVSDTGVAGEYPPGTGAIFAAGIVWGAKVRDGGNRLVRVNGSTYVSGLKAGKVLYNGSGGVIGSEDPDSRHIWRVRRDYRTGDLRGDARSFFHLDSLEASWAQIQAVYNQYDYDWQQWPAAEGAPFEDVDGNGQYDPARDIPGVPGADQTIWLVANDLPNADGTHVSPAFAGAPPIGIEMQMTLYAAQRWSLPDINKVIFTDVRLIYTGLTDTPDSAHIDTMYISQWADPDLGDFGDDLVSWDHNLDMGYVYDGSHHFVYPFSPMLPAVGHVLLEGPKAGGVKLGATAFLGMSPLWSFGTIGIYSGSLQWFNSMEGFLPHPEYPTQEPYNDLWGDPTKFYPDGDPVTGTGTVDGIQLPPGDRVYLISTGPFAMALGDTQEITVGLVGALGGDFPDNIVKLRESAGLARYHYFRGLPALPIPDPNAAPLPERYALSANYPNPFNPITRIDYLVPVVSILTLGVYNLLGQEIIRLVEQHAHPPGNFSVVWNGHSWKGQLMPAGIYLYRLEALPPYVLPGQGIVKTGKMVLLK